MGKGGDQGRSLPEVALPGRWSFGSDGQKIVTDVPDIEFNVLRDIAEYESDAWLPDRINKASKFVTTYLRHGTGGKRYNVHSPDGYVRVVILVQLPELKRNSVNVELLELIMMHAQSRIMMNDEGTKLKAIQGHTLMNRFDINLLYKEIKSMDHYVHRPMWRNADPPDQLVYELNHENYMGNWKRVGTFAPSVSQKFHTMEAVHGTAQQNLCAANVTICLFISMKALLDLMPNIEMYITQSGRIVTKCCLPWTAVTMIRRSNDEGTIIDTGQVGLQPPPAAPGGTKRVRSRDSRGEAYPPNNAQLPFPDGKVRTKRGGKELNTGFYNMLERKCSGSPWEQHRQLQMLKGVYKTERCNFDVRGGRCTKGDDCCFAHRSDNNSMIEATVKPFRRKIFNELYDAKFSLPLEHRHEIGKLSNEEYKIARQRRDDYDNRTGGRAQRPRHHDNSRSTRTSSIERGNTTPPPAERPSGSGQGNPPALTDGQEINEDKDRQRDHTSGDHNEDEDSDHEGAAAPIELNDDDIKIETPPEPAEPEAMQTSPLKDDEDVEPTLQLEQETADTEMPTGLPTEDMDMSTGLPEVEA